MSTLIHRKRVVLFFSGLLGLAGASCTPIGIGNGGGGNNVDGNVDSSLTSPLGKTFGEPNDAFTEAVAAVFVDGTARLQGTVAQRGDLDVFVLGALDRGDQLIVDTDTTAIGSVLDISVALFDGAGRLVSNNDDRSSSDFDSRMVPVLRHSSEAYYLVVTHSAFAPSGRFTGAYRVNITRTTDVTVPSAERQVVVLEFNGGTIQSSSLGNEVIGPFDAAAISRVYEGADEEMKESIVDTIVQNFERFDVDVFTTDEVTPGAGMSLVYIGCFNPTAFGIAEDVDLYNANQCDDAIIYAETFSPMAFSRTPTVTEMGVAIGNVTAHEIGHLLGLNHVDDDLAIMDDRSAPDAFLFDQEFKESPLSSDIMPIGTQDAALLLEEIVGVR